VLMHPTLDQLQQLGLQGMARAFAELEANPSAAELSHAEWLALLLDREATNRYDRRLRSRLRYARLRHQAAVEDVDYRAARGLDRVLFQTLAGGRWIEEAQNLIIEGPTGVGKSWLACALGQKACRDNRSVLYQRLPKMFADLALARGDGRYPRLMRAIGGVKLLILDDWGLEPLGPEQRRDMLEIVEERYGRGATLITSDRRPHPWRRDPGSRHPQRPSPAAQWRVLAQEGRAGRSSLTFSPTPWRHQTSPAGDAPPGRHQSERPADLDRNRWPTSSESALQAGDWLTSLIPRPLGAGSLFRLHRGHEVRRGRASTSDQSLSSGQLRP
jgi:DNA replication protein DnaC